MKPDEVIHRSAIAAVRNLADEWEEEAKSSRRIAEDNKGDSGKYKRWDEIAKEEETVARHLREMAREAANRRSLLGTRWIVRNGMRGDLSTEAMDKILKAIESTGEVREECQGISAGGESMHIVLLEYGDYGIKRWAVEIKKPQRIVTDHAEEFDARSRYDELALFIEAVKTE